jgi:hypothetical protein
MTFHELPPKKEAERMRQAKERVGQLLDLVDKALAQEANALEPDAVSMQSALREVRAHLVEQLRAARLRKQARRAVALGGALLVATIICVGGARHAEIVRNAQMVLVSTVWQGQAGPAMQKVANADDEDLLLPLERDRSGPGRISGNRPGDVARGARTYRKNRSLAKVTPAPAVGEGGAESASPELPASYLTLAIRTAPSHPPSSDISELLDRRK